MRAEPSRLRSPGVVHLVRRLGRGGVETGVVNVANRLVARGFDQAVLCLEDEGPLGDRLDPAIARHAADPERARGSLRRIVTASRILRVLRPDLVHARNTGAWIDGTTAWLLAGRPGRLAFSIHGLDWSGPLARSRRFLLRRLAGLSSSLAAVSAETARRFAQATGIAGARFDVLASGVDLERFRPAATGPVARADRPTTVICVARLDPAKGHTELLAAFAAATGERRAELVLVGDGPARAALEDLAERLGLADRVRFLGDRDDVPELLRSADLFVLFSRQEGRSTAVMEAMAAGLPVLAAEVGAMRELVTPGRTGTLVAPEDEAGRLRELARLLDDAGLRRRLGGAAAEFAAEHLGLEEMAERYAAHYRRLIAAPGGRLAGSPA